MTKTRKLKVFLCHASQDKPAVRELYALLNAETWIDPRLDQEKLLPGVDWDSAIEKAVRDSDVVIVCLSNNSLNKKGYVQKEIRVALDIADQIPDGQIYIIPLRFENCDVPYQLSKWQWVNYFDDKIFAYNLLVNALKSKIISNPSNLDVRERIVQLEGELSELRMELAFAYDATIEGWAKALEIPYCHHERWDGSGFPRGLKGKEIPLSARIFALVDVWDALRSDRSYRRSWPADKVLIYIKEQSGITFDPDLVPVFIKLIGKTIS